MQPCPASCLSGTHCCYVTFSALTFRDFVLRLELLALFEDYLGIF